MRTCPNSRYTDLLLNDKFNQTENITMNTMKLSLSLALLFALSMPALAVTNSPNVRATQAKQSNQLTASTVQLKQQAADTLAHSYELLVQGNPTGSLALLNSTINLFEQRYQLSTTPPSKAFTPSDIGKTNSYSQKLNAMNKEAPELSTHWNDLLYMKAYTLVETNDLNGAIKVLNTAIAYAPDRADNYSELGHIYQTQKSWEQAKTNFNYAYKVSEYSPYELQITHKTRALRGMGYVAIEQGQLDVARGYYSQSLQLDPNDKMAKMELGYIEELKLRR